jgi:hypothetical protein
MARRTAPPEPQPMRLTVEQMKIGIARLNRRIADLEGFNPGTVQQRWAAEVKALEASIEESLAAVFGHGTVEFNRYRGACRLDHGPITARPDWIAARSGSFGPPNIIHEVQR